MSITASVAWWARTEPTRDALIYQGQRISFGGLQARVEQAAGLMAGHGIGPGDVVALLMKNSAAFLELALAVTHAGGVLLPINYRLGAEEVDYILDHAGVKLLFADAEFKAAAGRRVPAVLLDEVAQRDSRALGEHAGIAPLCEPVHRRPDDLYRLMYTSGTTDRPKGVMHSFGNMAWKCMDHVAALGLSGQERLLVVGPLYHVGAFDLPGVAVWQMGGLLAVERDFDAEATLALIARERITGSWMAPVMLNRCLALPERGRFDLSSLRWLIGGGERTPEERIREFGSLFPRARYIDAYGLTESCSGDTMMEAGREIEKIGSTGRALAHVEVAILDDAGQPLAAGQNGEVCLRGPKVSQGYWRDPAKTRACFVDGWFRTGDVGHLDAEGFLFLTDRKKDMIISGGENIASSEVERVLYQLPQVAEAAVIGLPDPRWGECVTAVVVLCEGASLSQEQLREHCTGKLGGFKMPRRLIVAQALPRNPSGKVLKRQLREQYALPG
ncbi:MAG: AMP-binding protein [Comamonas sp.]